MNEHEAYFSADSFHTAFHFQDTMLAEYVIPALRKVYGRKFKPNARFAEQVRADGYRVSVQHTIDDEGMYSIWRLYKNEELVDKQWTVSLYDKEHKERMRILRQFAEEWRSRANGPHPGML